MVASQSCDSAGTALLVLGVFTKSSAARTKDTLARACSGGGGGSNSAGAGFVGRDGSASAVDLDCICGLGVHTGHMQAVAYSVMST